MHTARVGGSLDVDNNRTYCRFSACCCAYSAHASTNVVTGPNQTYRPVTSQRLTAEFYHTYWETWRANHTHVKPNKRHRAWSMTKNFQTRLRFTLMAPDIGMTVSFTQDVLCGPPTLPIQTLNNY